MAKLIELNGGKDWVDPSQITSISARDGFPGGDYQMPRVIIGMPNGMLIDVECSDYAGAIALAKRLGTEANLARTEDA
jgi:hypothetical protein